MQFVFIRSIYEISYLGKWQKRIDEYLDALCMEIDYIAEELKCKVEYNRETREIFIENGKTKLVYQIGSTTYTNDGLKKTMDVAPEVVENRTFVPLRAVAEALNCDVQWLANQRMVVISPVNYPWDNENKIEKKLLSEVQLMMSALIRDLAYANQ